MITYNAGHRLALSVKRLKTKLSDNQYRFAYWAFLSALPFRHKQIYFFEEKDKHNILHIHGVIELEEEMRLDNLHELLKLKGYNVNVTNLNDPKKWILYASNDGKNEMLKEPELELFSDFTYDQVIGTNLI